MGAIPARLPDSLHAADLLGAAVPGESIPGAPEVGAMEIIEEVGPPGKAARSRSVA
ncbi:hypothetical protein [Salmonella enterica]|uniref:hypothetical protein n=1 Tax=Salmonella enterica TaxID=28901 RepID=UPI003975AAAF